MTIRPIFIIGRCSGGYLSVITIAKFSKTEFHCNSILVHYVFCQCRYPRGEPLRVRLQFALLVPFHVKPAVVYDDVLVPGVQEALQHHLLSLLHDQILACGRQMTTLRETVAVKLSSPCISPHLMQLSGSLVQSVLHLNRSQVIHPIGGVRARPLSRPRHAGAAHR